MWVGVERTGGARGGGGEYSAAGDGVVKPLTRVSFDFIGQENWRHKEIGRSSRCYLRLLLLLLLLLSFLFFFSFFVFFFIIIVPQTKILGVVVIGEIVAYVTVESLHR